MKRAECCRKQTSWTVPPGVALTAALPRSGRRSNRSFATSATSTVLDTTAVTGATMIGAGTTATIETTIETTIGGDEFQSLGTNPHLTSACNPPVYPSKGLGSMPGPLSVSNLVYLVILSKIVL